MPIQKLRPSYTFTQDRLTELQSVIPEAFADGRINWDALQEALGAFLEEERLDAEHFGLSWPGKRDARRLVSLPSKGTLMPAPGEGINEDTTSNIFVEGDNLEVLKLLQKSYASRIKMIYIDPPYNTGRDFVYKDDFREPLEDYLKKTGQADEEGKILTTNSRSDGRFHTNWLNMMYPRLRLARTLLENDGAIFVSIDDTEMPHLRLLMNEIFGEENFVAQVVWQKVYSPRMDAKGFSEDHDYILIYRRSDQFVVKRIPFEQNVKQFSGVGDDGRQFRPRSLRKEGKNSRRIDRPNLFYKLIAPDGSEVLPIRSDGSEGCWRWARGKYESAKEQDLVEWVQTKNGWQVYVKQFFDEKATRPPSTVWTHTEVGHNHQAVDELKELFGEAVFDNPKPIRLIKRMLELCSDPEEEDIVLDFFAGSCTTAQAVLELNHEDGGSRHFLCVQFPEPTPLNSAARKAGFSTISQISKQRILRVIAKLQRIAQNTLIAPDREEPEDLGFRVFKLTHSHYKTWQDYSGQSIQELETLFDKIETPLIEGWSENDLLTEILLLQGFPLDSTIVRQVAFTQNTVLLVDSDACAHRLFVCLDEKITDDTISQLQLTSDDVFVCLDSALTDQSKMRLMDVCTLNII